MQRRMSPDSYLTPYIKTNFKWIKDLNMKPETVKKKKKNTRKKMYRKSFLTFFFFNIILYSVKYILKPWVGTVDKQTCKS